MPKTPTGAKRPADVTRNAVLVMKLATGECEEKSPPKGSQASGKRGGEARAAALSKRQRTQSAKSAAKARWSKK